MVASELPVSTQSVSLFIRNLHFLILNKIINPSTILKSFRSILKFFSNNEKVPRIQLLFQENIFATDFECKNELLIFCLKQGPLISFLPFCLKLINMYLTSHF